MCLRRAGKLWRADEEQVVAQGSPFKPCGSSGSFMFDGWAGQSLGIVGAFTAPGGTWRNQSIGPTPSSPSSIRGVAAWNQWRMEHPETNPFVAGVDLHGADLKGAEFSATSVSRFMGGAGELPPGGEAGQP